MNKIFFFTLILMTTSLSAASTKELVHEKKVIKLSFEEKRHTLVSENCKDLEKCFFGKAITLKTYPNQSPGFSLCYQLGGEPFFGTIKDQKKKEPICKKGEFFANHEAILYHYRDHHFKAKK